MTKNTLLHLFCWIGIGSGLFIACEADVTGCMEPQAPNYDNSASNPCDNCCEKRIEYRVSGSFSNIDIEYLDATGDTQEIGQVNSDWSKEVTRKVRADVYIDVTSNTESGDIRAKVYENNDLYKEAYSSSRYAQEEIVGTVPQYQ